MGEENRHRRGCGGGDSSQLAAGSTKTGAMAEWISRAIAAAGSVVEGGRGGGTGAWRISHRAGLAPGVWQADAHHGGRTVHIGTGHSMVTKSMDGPGAFLAVSLAACGFMWTV